MKLERKRNVNRIRQNIRVLRSVLEFAEAFERYVYQVRQISVPHLPPSRRPGVIPTKELISSNNILRWEAEI